MALALLDCAALSGLDDLSVDPGSATENDARVGEAAALDDSRPTGSAARDGGDGAAAFPDARLSEADAGDSEVLLIADDFDKGTLPGGWDDVVALDGSVTLDTSRFVSPARSLLAASSALTTGGATDTLRKHVPMPAAGSTAIFQVSTNFVEVDNTHQSNAVIADIQLRDAAGDLYELQINADAAAGGGAADVTFGETMIAVDGGQSNINHPPSIAFAIGVWKRIRVELAWSVSPSARVFIDDALQLETPLSAPFAGIQMDIEVGLGFVRSPSDAWRVAYDDVAYGIR